MKFDASETYHWTELACPLCGEPTEYAYVEELAGNPDGLSYECECGADVDIGAAHYMVTATREEEGDD